MLRSLFCYIFFFVLSNSLFAQNSTALLQEQILNYDVILTLEKNGLLTVEETIKVNVKGEQIKRGIYRKIPLERKDQYGDDQRVSYNVIEVLHNATEAKYNKSIKGDYLNIRIGEKDVFLDHEEHTYKITYTTTDQVGFFENYDELYWNATGTEWLLPINKVTVKVKLPEGATSNQEYCYTGAKGSTVRNCRFKNEEGYVIFEADSLQKYQGLTIATGFTKGIMENPLPIEKPSIWIRNLDVYLTSAITVIYLLFLFFSWALLSRKFKKEVVVPTFKVPKNISPAMARLLVFKRIDDISLVATLVNLHVKKYIRITKKKHTYLIEHNADSTSDMLEIDQQKFFKELFGYLKRPIYLNKKYNSFMSDAKKALLKSLKNDFNKSNLLKSKVPYVILSVIITIAAYGYLHVYAVKEDPIHVLILSVVFGIIATVGYNLAKNSKRMSAGEVFFFLIFFLIFSLGFLFVGIGDEKFPFICFPLSVIFIAANWMFIKNLQILSKKEGIKARLEILGLKKYITVAEQDRFDMLNDPDKSLEFYEELLPYAIAFGLENRWAEKFNTVLEKTILEEDSFINNYSNDFSIRMSNFVGASYTGTGGSFSSSSTGSSSSSGSGSSGGGYSGSGGGGGGGGGW